MVRRSYFVKYSTTKKRTEISNFLPPVPITLFHSFFFQEKKKKKRRRKSWGKSAIQRYLKPGIFPEPSFPELRVHTTPQVSPVLGPRVSRPLWARAAGRHGLPSSPRHRIALCAAADNGISGWNASIRRGNSGRGASYRLLESKPAQTYALAAGRRGWLAGWLFDLILFRGQEKKEGKGRKGEGGAHTHTADLTSTLKYCSALHTVAHKIQRKVCKKNTLDWDTKSNRLPVLNASTIIVNCASVDGRSLSFSLFALNKYTNKPTPAVSVKSP